MNKVGQFVIIFNLVIGFSVNAKNDSSLILEQKEFRINLELVKLKNQQLNVLQSQDHLRDDFRREFETYKNYQNEKLNQYLIFAALFFSFLAFSFNFLVEKLLRIGLNRLF
ncbi:hypothetical protein VR611_12175 [Aquirufa nivalisilvae]